MKITLLGTAYPYRGGLANFSERLMQEFALQRHQVHIETFTLQYPSFLFPGVSQYDKRAVPEHVSITRTLNSINPISWIKLGLKIKKDKPDLLIIAYWLPFMSPAFSTVAYLAGTNRHTKVVAIMHNVIPHEKRLGDHVLSKLFTKSVDGFIAMTQSVLNDIKLFDHNKPRLQSPHPLFDNFGELLSKKEAANRLDISSESQYLLFFGLIRDYKGLDWLLEALPSVFEQFPNLKLLVAGEFYSPSKPYFDTIARLNLQGKVIFHQRFIPDDLVNLYFSVADIVVLPYKTATQSGVTQIAYHFEKPIIVTDVGGLKEMVPHGKVGFVVQPDPNAISEAIIKFYNNNSEPEFVRELKIEKQKYSWDKMCQAILKVYQQTTQHINLPGGRQANKPISESIYLRQIYRPPEAEDRQINK